MKICRLLEHLLKKNSQMKLVWSSAEIQSPKGSLIETLEAAITELLMSELWWKVIAEHILNITNITNIIDIMKIYMGLKKSWETDRLH